MGAQVGRLGISAEHEALHDAVRGWCSRHVPREVPRSCLDGGRPDLGALRSAMVEQGWFSLPADYGLPETGVVLEELGRACTPGPHLPSMVVAAALAAAGVPLLEGPSALAWGSAPVRVDGGRVFGRCEAVVGGADAALLLVPGATDGGPLKWWRVQAAGPGVLRTDRTPVDPTRSVVDVAFDGAQAGGALDLPPGVVEALAVRLWCADALGSAAWCVETAATYATEREQFGQPIGRFQAVKHRCADLLCALELARAATWDALRAPLEGPEGELATAVAAALVPGAHATCAQGCVQVLGGIGFTWEHDAHLHLRRSIATGAAIGPAHRWRRRVAELAAGGARRPVSVELPPEAEAERATIGAALDEVAAHDKAEWRRLLADGGWIAPHWPAPWGRDAAPVEQLVIDEELAARHIRRPHLQVGAWVLPTILAHGTDDQQERYLRPTLRGELAWCQLFSEPGAGSDLASLATKAVRTELVDGRRGWLLTGQKVWTSMADQADVGLCLARTDAGVDRHDGITAFVVDMRAPGIELRPLRELTGLAFFFEVFLTDVFVADEDVVGPVGGGWAAARTTLANERVSMGQGSSFGLGVELVLGLLGPDLAAADPVDVDHVGGLLATAEALAMLGARMTLRSLEGTATGPGPEASVRKLLGVEHDQRAQEVGLGILGRAGLADDGDASSWLYGFLANRCLSIAGGTSEIQRNVIGERLLGLPRD
jgi:alkylation response protein AidB-like acyl-CoA dehydrogenase